MYCARRQFNMRKHTLEIEKSKEGEKSWREKLP
jgi:hypothetical protein